MRAGSTHFRRELQDVGFNPSQDIRLDHLVQFLHERLRQILEPCLEFLQIAVRQLESPGSLSGVPELVRVEEVQQVEQLAEVIVQRRARQQYPLDAVQRLEAVEDRVGVGFD